MIGQKTNLLHVGGVETHVRYLAQELEARGHEVVTFVRARYGYDPGRSDADRVVPRPCLATKHLEAISHTLLCGLEAGLRRFDVVHFHGVGPALAIPAARISGTAAVCVTIHDQDYNKDKWSEGARRALRRGERSAVRRADGLIVVARYLQRHIAESYGREATYIPNGAESLTFAEPGETLRTHGLEPGRYLLSVGRLVPEKGIDHLIAAIRASTTPYTMAIVGGTSHSDGYVDRLHQLAGDDVRIRFLGRQVGPALAEIRSHAAAYVMPSLQEGLPLTMLEALWFGMPVIATDIPATNELDPTALAGRVRLVPPADPEALRKAIEDLPFPGAPNHPGSLEWPSWGDVAEQVERVYESVVAARSDPVATGSTNYQPSGDPRVPEAPEGRL
jgi:glycosyltransferase involved in cell wall biosynthesis